MPAQLIFIAKDAQGASGEKETKKQEQKASDASSDGKELDKPRRFPTHRKIPIGVLNVVGQDPVDIGSFATLDELLERARSCEISSERSNTVFGSVGTIGGLGEERGLHLLHDRLNQLPKQLTIIVQEEKRRA